MSSYYYNYTDYDDECDEDYEVGGTQKIKKRSNGKSEFKGKGHQTKYGRANKQVQRDFWDRCDPEPISLNFGNKSTSNPVVINKPTISKDVSQRESQPGILGPHCECIKGVVIDFDRLANIEPVEQEYNGYVTYGIKFLFAGKKGLFRIIWYNKNKTIRDEVYTEKIEYWHSITNVKNGGKN